MATLMKTASNALMNQTTRNDCRLDENNTDPAPRTGILLYLSSGRFDQDSKESSACDGLLKINKAFKRIDDVMTSMQEWNSDSKVTAEERDELAL